MFEILFLSRGFRDNSLAAGFDDGGRVEEGFEFFFPSFGDAGDDVVEVLVANIEPLFAAFVEESEGGFDLSDGFGDSGDFDPFVTGDEVDAEGFFDFPEVGFLTAVEEGEVPCVWEVEFFDFRLRELKFWHDSG